MRPGRRGSRPRQVRLACSEDHLEEALRSFSPPKPEALRRLRLWSEELERWSRIQRLVGWTDSNGLLVEGVADAWAMLPLLADYEPSPLVDLGSGAGLPGLILAAAHPDRPVHLVERRRKRVAFLREAARAMELRFVTVHHGRTEQLCHRVELDSPPIVTARALSTPTEILGFADSWKAGACIVTVGKGGLPEALPGGWTLHRTAVGSPGPDRQHALLIRD